jgi:hypothetical protein
MNLRGLVPNSHIHVSVSDLCIPTSRSSYFAAENKRTEKWEYTNRSQIHECGNWLQGRAVSFMGIHKSDLLCSASQNSVLFTKLLVFINFSFDCR